MLLPLRGAEEGEVRRGAPQREPSHRPRSWHSPDEVAAGGTSFLSPRLCPTLVTLDSWSPTTT